MYVCMYVYVYKQDEQLVKNIADPSSKEFQKLQVHFFFSKEEHGGPVLERNPEAPGTITLNPKP